MHKLPDLPYKFNALEPHIDAATMEIHHDKHHAGYVAKLNTALEKYSDLQEKSVEDLLRGFDNIPDDIKQAVANSGGGHANHSLFWRVLSPDGGGKPSGELAKAIDSEFGSFDKFKNTFTEKALGVFGSGWAFLAVDKSGKLICKRHSFQNSPLMYGSTPIMGLDVWEHAYYLKYQNRRAEYVEAFWNIVNWEEVGNNFKSSTS